jgi:YebC/PmpR family DNA-binding regulatory protein
MGAQWKVAGKAEGAAKKSGVFTKLAKEISVAAKLGGPDPDANGRLRAAMESARKASMPKDTIERNIKKGAGLLGEPMNLETITYEGFAPHKVPLIVECVTDNKNRTNSDLRVLFRKGQLGNSGSVGWMFDRLGVIEATHSDKSMDMEGAAIEANAQNVEPLEKTEMGDGAVGARFFTAPTDLDAVGKYLQKSGWTITTSELSYIAKNQVELSAEQKKEVSDFLNDIDDHDDVHRIYTAVKG